MNNEATNKMFTVSPRWPPNLSNFSFEEQKKKLLKIKSVEVYEIKLIWIKTKKNEYDIFHHIYLMDKTPKKNR